MNFTELAKNRFTVRKYIKKKVEQEKLKEVLEVALLAPTAKNNQPWKIYVLQTKESLDKLDKLTHCRYNASTVLIFTYKEDEVWTNPLEEGIHSGVEDVSIVATHVMLKACELGLNTTWCNYFSNSKLEKDFNFNPNERCVLIMPIGYREDSATPTPMHESTKDFETLIKFI